MRAPAVDDKVHIVALPSAGWGHVTSPLQLSLSLLESRDHLHLTVLCTTESHTKVLQQLDRQPHLAPEARRRVQAPCVQENARPGCFPDNWVEPTAVNPPGVAALLEELMITKGGGGVGDRFRITPRFIIYDLFQSATPLTVRAVEEMLDMPHCPCLDRAPVPTSMMLQAELGKDVWVDDHPAVRTVYSQDEQKIINFLARMQAERGGRSVASIRSVQKPANTLRSVWWPVRRPEVVKYLVESLLATDIPYVFATASRLSKLDQDLWVKVEASGRGMIVPSVPQKTVLPGSSLLLSYSLGEFHHQNFTEQQDCAAPSPSINGLVQHLRQTGVESRPSIRAGSSASHPPSTALTDPTAARPSATATEATTESEYEDFHPDITSAGQTNQDLSIPDISLEDQLTGGANGDRDKQQMFKFNSQGNLKENDYRIPAELLKRVNQVQAEAQGEADVEDGRESRRRVSRDGRRRRPQQVQLASVAKPISQESSDESINPGSFVRRRPPGPGSRTSYPSTGSRSQGESITTGVVTNPVDAVLLESGSGTTTSSASRADLPYDHASERQRILEFYETHGYMPAPKQTPEAMRRRLRVIRRLGLENLGEYHKQTLNRFTRLAVSIFKTKMALVSVIGKDRQIFLSEIGFGRESTEFEAAFCCHTIMGTGEECMVVPNAAEDWRFRNNPLTAGGKGPVQFYAGAPLRIGRGCKAAIIGSMCIIDDQPRTMDEAQRTLLMDLADCVVSELGLLSSQQASIEGVKLHQISVDFLRRSFKNRPTERARKSRSSAAAGTVSMSSSSTGKRKEEADRHQSDDEIEVYNEACREIRLGLDAYAVAVVDLSQFHLFYPSFENSSTGGTPARGGSTSGRTRSSGPGLRSPPQRSGPGCGTPSSHPKNPSTESIVTDGTDNYAQSNHVRRAKETYSVIDCLTPSRTPQVLFILSRSRGSKLDQRRGEDDRLAVLGYSCAHDKFAFNLTSSPAARKIISDFIVNNVKSGRVWYTRDDSEGIAQSITHLMPPGTETSMAMPVFGFDGQVAFAVLACWTDPLYTYPAGAMQFVETIAGILRASGTSFPLLCGGMMLIQAVMKEKFHQAERAQLNFAAVASHELRTPLHQINAAAALLRHSLHATIAQPGTEMALESSACPSSTSQGHPPPTPVAASLDDRLEALAQLEIIEASGLALGHILENIIDTLDIGARLEAKTNPEAVSVPSKPGGRTTDFAQVVEGVVKDAIGLEIKSRNVAGVQGMDDIEIILEILPRGRGRWLMSDDSGPLARALGKVIHNACKFTEKGYVHITVQDASQDMVLAAGCDDSVRLSTVMIDVEDTGRGVSAEFLEGEVLGSFSNADPFMPGSGLGLGLAQRMIKILGGKLVISSHLNKGTLVHIEIPLYLHNEDNESDQEAIDAEENREIASRPRTPVRQDGIYLTGFERVHVGMRRLGRSLFRQLQLHFCRVVESIQFASSIVLPEGILPDEEVAQLVSGARPNVEIIYLAPATYVHSPTATLGPRSATRGTAKEILSRVPTTRLLRPIGPTAIARIIRPSEQQPQQHEEFASPVVCPEGARWDYGGGAGGDGVAASRRGSVPGYTGEGQELVPFPPRTSHASQQPLSVNSPSSPKSQALPNDRVPRSDVREVASDALTAVKGDAGQARPGTKEHRSEMVQERDGDKDAGPLRVLIVEDNAINRKILTTMLKRVACHYAEAVDGNDAVTIFNVFHPDLVLLDINMPVKDGFQAAAEMRDIEHNQGRKRARVIAVTALSGEAHRRKGIEASIDLWLVKPVGMKQLKEEVERMITKDGERVE